MNPVHSHCLPLKALHVEWCMLVHKWRWGQPWSMSIECCHVCETTSTRHRACIAIGHTMHKSWPHGRRLRGLMKNIVTSEPVSPKVDAKLHSPNNFPMTIEALSVHIAMPTLLSSLMMIHTVKYTGPLCTVHGGINIGMWILSFWWYIST